MAFEGCSNLNRVNIPYGIKSIKIKDIIPYTTEIIIAPHLWIDLYDAKIKRALAAGFALASESGAPGADEWKKEYLKYIRNQKKKLYPLAAKVPALLRIMTSEKIIPKEDLETLVELAQNEAKIRKEVFQNAEEEKHKTDGLSGRDKFNAITDSLRDD